MVKPKENTDLSKTDETDISTPSDKKASMMDDIDLNEIIETTNLEILPKYDKIDSTDLKTTRKVKIVALPKAKFVEKVGKDLLFMEIIDDNVKYSLGADSIALRRSLVSCAIKLLKAKTKEQIDLSVLLNKTLCINRRQFTAQGFTQAPYSFSIPSE